MGDMERPLPDLPHRMFVYGSLKTGQPNHDELIKGERGVARYLGPARTRTAYPLVIFTQWNIPFLLYAPGKGQIISGEIYDVDDQCLKWLDKLETHPELYVREYITVDLLSHDVTGSVPSGINSNKVSLDPASSDTNGCVKPGQVKCWVYFLKDFPPSMLNLEMHSSYDDSKEIHPKFTKTNGEKILKEIRQSLGRDEQSQLL